LSRISAMARKLWLNRETITRRLRRVLPATIALLLLLGIAGASLAGVGLMRAARTAQELLVANPSDVDLEALGSLLRATRRNTVVLKWTVGWMAPLGPRLTWVPRIGPVLEQAPAMLELGDTLTALGVLLWKDIVPAATAYQQGAPLSPLLPELVTNLSQESVRKVALAQRAESAYSALDVSTLPYRFQDPVAKLGKVLPLLQSGLELADRLPLLLGFDAPRTYLILALNESELRPSGGFITGVAEVRLSNAEMLSMVFKDSYAADDFTRPYPDAPEPLEFFMGVELWVFRDSNWSPDFPTAAQQAIALYRPGYPVDIDGVIGLDQQAVKQLVGALGPLTTPGQADPVTADTVFEYMHAAWAPEEGVLDGAWFRQRKDFMGDLAGAAMARLASGDVNHMLLMQEGLALLQERHLQVYVEDEPTARVLASKGWDGGLPLPSAGGDFLAVVEANVGYNKASTHIGRRLFYEVDLTHAVPQAAVELHYRNLNPASKPCDATIRYDPKYEDMMDRCYWAHVRLYTPANSSLQTASRHPIPADLLVTGMAWSGEAQTTLDQGYTVFSQAFLLPRAEAEILRFTYELPASVLAGQSSSVRTYRLVIHKQAGWDSLDAVVSLRLPGNAVVLTAHPQPVQREEGVLVYDIVSKTDIAIVLQYQVQGE
jgi:hypothetical protein